MARTDPSNASGRGTGFTLVELLTVIAIIAVLATLLMTTFGSVKRRAREAVCTSNLHQIGIGLHMYLDDFKRRPEDLVALASSKYCGDGRILSCPADRAPRTTQPADSTISNSTALPQTSTTSASPHVSYQHPLAWTDEQWERLMQAGTQAGVVSCTWHDVQASLAGPADMLAFQGLILRGQLDGGVVRREVIPVPGTPLPAGNSGPVSGFAAAAATPNSNVNSSAPPWQFFSDDPPP